jgi:HAD superfamily hydrolase (TIGR01509 family)
VIRALVFDFDGLILDTEVPIFTAWHEQFVAHGCEPVTIEEWAAEIGTVGGLDMEALLVERSTMTVDLTSAQARRRARRDELLSAETVRPGVHAWIADARSRGWPVAIASSSDREWITMHLGRLDIRDSFDAVVCAGGDCAAKPEPDVYLAACTALRVGPNEALAIEDSPHGITAAKRAGLKCVAVPNAITAQLDTSHADVVLESLAAASIADVLARLSL